MTEEEYPVALICDNNYVIPTAVAVRSMIDSFRRKGKLTVCIIACGVDEKNKALLRKMKRRNVKLRIIDYDAANLGLFNENGYYVTGTALVKFCIPRLLPEYDKILYIDGDVLIQKDITELFSINIDSYYAAVVADMAAVVSCKWHIRLGLKNYFNSGLILFNAEKFREEGLEKRLFAVKKAHPEYQCMDQDVFNDVFDTNVRFLSQEWNLMMPNFLLMQEQMELTIKDINSFYGSNYESLMDMEHDACIIHLTNEKKPWKYSDIYMSKEWYRIFKKTPFRCIKLHREKSVIAPKPLRSRRVGPLHFLSFEDRTDVCILGIPVIQKKYVSPVSTLWFCGIPVAKRIWYEYEVVTKIFFFIRFRKPNWYNIEEKFDTCIGMLQRGADTGLFVRNVLSQLERTKEKAI